MRTNLKKLRKATGMTANDFAESIGVNRYTYRSWEQGTRDYDIEQAVQLADIFDVTLDKLIRYEPEVEYSFVEFADTEGSDRDA